MPHGFPCAGARRFCGGGFNCFQPATGLQPHLGVKREFAPDAQKLSAKTALCEFAPGGGQAD